MTAPDRPRRPLVAITSAAVLAGLTMSALAEPAWGQRSAPRDTTPKMEIYGFGQADAIMDFRRINPDWFDVNRPTKLPAFGSEFNANGNFWFSARQSRFGVKASTPTERGDVFARFEFDMFGVGIDAGQTTIRLRHAYGQWGWFGAGQLESPFMDVDVFPNILDYWGPNGMLFFRNVQVFWQPIDRSDGTRLTFALERPGASGDQGRVADRIQIQNTLGRFPYPDVSGGFRLGWKHGYVRISGILRDIHWEQVPTDTFDLSGHVTAGGGSISSNIKWRDNLDIIRLQVVYGVGIQNYFNDAPVDVGVCRNINNPRTPVCGEALPIFGAVTFLDHWWNSRWSTSIGWSMVNIDNSDLQTAAAFHNGQYGIGNILWTPVKNVLIGGEFQFGRRVNFSDDFSFNDYRAQFSFKYSFAKTFGGKP